MQRSRIGGTTIVQVDSFPSDYPLEMYALTPQMLQTLLEQLVSMGEDLVRLNPDRGLMVVGMRPKDVVSRITNYALFGLARTIALEASWSAIPVNFIVPGRHPDVAAWVKITEDLPITGQIFIEHDADSPELPPYPALALPSRRISPTGNLPRTVVVTGGARGQGRAHALWWARRGARIAIIDWTGTVDGISYPLSTQDDMARTVAAIQQAGVAVLAFSADVRDFDAVHTVFQQIARVWGPPHIVIANAGVFSFGLRQELTHEAWLNTIAINMFGPWYAAMAARPGLESTQGTLVVVGSTASLKGMAGLAAYDFSKHGVLALTRELARSWQPMGIQVLAVCPTAIDTPLLQNQSVYDYFSGHPGGTREFMADALRNMHALPRDLLTPQEVAEATGRFIQHTRSLSGMVLAVDAGFTVR